MWDDDRKGWLTLAWFSGFGSRTLRKLRRRFDGDGVRAMKATRKQLLHCGITERASDGYLAFRSKVDPDMLMRRLDAESIRFVLPPDDEYPSYLLHASDPPESLFIRGAPIVLTRPVAVIGTRAMTHYGATATKLLVGELARAGCEIISGLALGIDGMAHRAALDAGARTIAVLAGGINDDAIYPRNHLRLAARILEEGGSIVSEFPPGTESLRHLFPLRNRIIASMSTVTIVVEAAESSGSLVTAKLALEENRDVFAVPGPITSEQSAGTNRLLVHGATPCLNAQDVLSLFGKNVSPPPKPPPLSEEDLDLLQLLERPFHIDDIIRTLELPTATITSRLAVLVLHGCVEQQSGDMYARSAMGRAAVETE
ncbi:MAG: DNA-processing protein DprA [Patescibacteria group bacterium]|jgi:DNA processing protein